MCFAGHPFFGLRRWTFFIWSAPLSHILRRLRLSQVSLVWTQKGSWALGLCGHIIQNTHRRRLPRAHARTARLHCTSPSVSLGTITKSDEVCSAKKQEVTAVGVRPPACARVRARSPKVTVSHYSTFVMVKTAQMFFLINFMFIRSCIVSWITSTRVQGGW